MKTLIIILSLVSSSSFAQYTFTVNQMLSIAKMSENYHYYYGLDSINNLEIKNYQLIINSQSSIIVNKNKEIEIINLRLNKCRNKQATYKWVAISAGALFGALLINR